MIDRLDNFKNIPEATRTVVTGERRLKWGSGIFFCAYQRRHDWAKYNDAGKRAAQGRRGHGEFINDRRRAAEKDY
jgi:hypothetical protein